MTKVSVYSDSPMASVNFEARIQDCVRRGTHRIVDGKRLWVLDVGDGPTVVFLHGNPSSSFSFRHQVAALADRYRVVAPDLLGFGSSEACPEGATFLEHAALFEALAEQLKLDSVRLVLHDWGGPIGLRWAVRHPSRVAQLVLANTTAGRKIHAPRWWNIFTAPLTGELSVVWTRLFVAVAGAVRLRSSGETYARHHYRNAFASSAARRVLLQLERLNGFDEIMEEIEGGRCRLDAIPCLLLWGEPEIYFRDGLRHLQSVFPRAEVVRISGGGHFLFERKSDEVNRSLERFFETGCEAREPAL